MPYLCLWCHDIKRVVSISGSSLGCRTCTANLTPRGWFSSILYKLLVIYLASSAVRSQHASEEQKSLIWTSMSLPSTVFFIPLLLFIHSVELRKSGILTLVTVFRHAVSLFSTLWWLSRPFSAGLVASHTRVCMLWKFANLIGFTGGGQRYQRHTLKVWLYATTAAVWHRDSNAAVKAVRKHVSALQTLDLVEGQMCWTFFSVSFSFSFLLFALGEFTLNEKLSSSSK